MKNSVVILIFIVWAGSVSAQTFTKTSTFDLSTFYFRSLFANDTSIYATGFGADTIEPTKPKMFIAKYDLNGSLLEFVNPLDTFSDSFFNAENSILDFDSTLIFLSKYSNSIVFNSPCLFKTKKNLELKQIEKLEFPNFASVNSFGLIKISNEKFLLLTSVQYKSGDNIDVFLHLINKDFSIIWSKIYGILKKYDVPYSAIKLNSGNLFIGAHRTDPGGTVAGQRYKEQTWIFEIDTAGNMVREFLDTNTRTGPAKGLTQSASGGYVYCGKYQTGFDGHLSYNWGGSITKIDNKLQNKVWEKIVTDTSSNAVSLESILKVGNRYIAIGNNIGYTETNVFNEIVSGYFISFNENGNKIYDRYYSGKDSSDQYYRHYLYSITKDKLNSIIAVGQVDPSQTQTQGWIIKLDSLGCLASTNCGNPGLFVQESKELFYEFDIYPNPVKETLFINTHEIIERLKIYNTLGQLVVEQRFPPNQVSLSSLRSGLYFMNVKTAQGVFTKKFVKE